MSFWFRRGNRKRKGFLFHAVQFLIYTIIISAVGSIINYVIENYKLKFITPGVIDFICTSLIAVILTIKLFLLINQFEKQQIKKGRVIMLMAFHRHIAKRRDELTTGKPFLYQAFSSHRHPNMIHRGNNSYNTENGFRWIGDDTFFIENIYRSCDSVSLQVIIHVIIPPKPAFHIVYWHKSVLHPARFSFR